MRLFSTQLSTSGNKQTPTFKLPVRNLLHSMVFIFIFTTFSIVATSWEWCSEQRICKITIFFYFCFVKVSTFCFHDSFANPWPSLADLHEVTLSLQWLTWGISWLLMRPRPLLVWSTPHALSANCLNPLKSASFLHVSTLEDQHETMKCFLFLQPCEACTSKFGLGDFILFRSICIYVHISVFINIKQHVLSWDTSEIHRVLLAGTSLYQVFRRDCVDQAFMAK